MRVFVVLVNAMSTVQLASVCRTKAAAREQLSKITFGSNPRIEEVCVTGIQKIQNILYSSECYEKSRDLYCYKGIFGNVEQARRAAGPNGLVLPHTI